MPALDLTIAKGDWSDYQKSLRIIADRLTPEERREFDQALQELKFQVMSGNGIAKNPELRGDLRAQLAGLTVRDVLELNCTIKLGRKKEQEVALLRSIVMNARLRTKPGDDESSDFLKSSREEQAKQLATLRSEISALAKRIEELRPTSAQPRPF